MKKFDYFLFAALLGLTAALSAQNKAPTTEELRQRVNALKQQVEMLKTAVDWYSKLVPVEGATVTTGSEATTKRMTPVPAPVRRTKTVAPTSTAKPVPVAPGYKVVLDRATGKKYVVAVE